MLTRLKDRLIVITAEMPDEQTSMAEWADAMEEHAFVDRISERSG